MDMNQIVEAALKYKALLPPPRQIDSSRKLINIHETFVHCAWMCDEIIAGKMSEAKAMRWLCFVQGCLWSNNVLTIEQMKDDNRPHIGEDPRIL